MGEFQKINSVLVDGGDRYGASAVTFDSAEELVWIGNQGVSYIQLHTYARILEMQAVLQFKSFGLI